MLKILTGPVNADNTIFIYNELVCEDNIIAIMGLNTIKTSHHACFA